MGRIRNLVNLATKGRYLHNPQAERHEVTSDLNAPTEPIPWNGSVDAGNPNPIKTRVNENGDVEYYRKSNETRR